MRAEFEMTEAEWAQIVEIRDAPEVFVMAGGQHLNRQLRANAFWSDMGKRDGFDPKSVRPIPGKEQRFFSAVLT